MPHRIKKVQPVVSLSEMGMCLSYAMDLLNAEIVDHHHRVAYIGVSLAEELGMPWDERDRIFMAAIIHDIGAFSIRERLKALRFEPTEPMHHAEVGYRLIAEFKPFAGIAPVVRHHHRRWNNGRNRRVGGEEVPVLSHLLNLADRVAVLVDPHSEILGQAAGIGETISRLSGSHFVPDFVKAFMRLKDKEIFWLDVISPALPEILRRRPNVGLISLDANDFVSLAKLFAKIIDFRSAFTATHSGGVASVAEALAGAMGMREEEIRMIRIAGYLHDLGKLSIPLEILEKPGRLSAAEFHRVKQHPYHSYRIIEHVKGLELINEWGSSHHETLNGKGYPFHYSGHELCTAARIMAIADVFTALTEDRPYRKGMQEDEVVRTLGDMVASEALDGDIVSLLLRRYREINNIRQGAQAMEYREYLDFMARLPKTSLR